MSALEAVTSGTKYFTSTLAVLNGIDRGRQYRQFWGFVFHGFSSPFFYKFSRRLLGWAGAVEVFFDCRSSSYLRKLRQQFSYSQSAYAPEPSL